MENVGRWLPGSVDPTTLADSLGNKQLYPQTVPVTKQDLYLELALLIEDLRKHPEDVLKDGKIIVSEKLFTISPSRGELVLVVLNAVEPEGIKEIERLGTVIVPKGTVQKEQTVCEMKVDLGTTDTQTIQVMFDELVLIPLPPQEKATVEIICKRPFSIEGKMKIKREVVGGEVGIVIDGRGRPFVPPAMDAQGRKRMLKWRKVLESGFYE